MNAITIGIVDDQIRPFEFPADNPLFNILSGKSKRDFVAYGLTGVQAAVAIHLISIGQSYLQFKI
jgi:hypothetical protein